MRILQGVVVSDKMNKTRVVSISRKKKHPRYGKYYISHLRVKVHDEKNEMRAGDLVRITETRPLSREKRWRFLSLIRRKEVNKSVVD